ncbi:tubulin alpha chain-like isoform X2 [Cimex lectularius]|uniref:Tubulin alpha chain n=1 Tax=Cimex lectularius TaxID=79782 RepID=A0A8I6TBV4_CIMLE|nr:tubulin alpha chain-like isoform X2 [Cimex lectularius]
MREVISLHLGQAGIQLALPLWKLYCEEHGIQLDGKITEGAACNGSCFSSHFTRTQDDRCIPNALLLDLDPSVAGSDKNDVIVKELFGKDNFLTWKEDAANIFQRGFIMGSERISQVGDRLSSMLELCDSFQGFIIFRSAGGGTGSGFTSSLFEHLSDNMKKKCNIELAVYPSKGSAVLEPYNTVLGLHRMMNFVNCSFVVDNEALFNMSKKNVSSYKSSFIDVNRLVANAVSTITASIRFEGCLNVDLNEFQTNLVPYSRVHFPFMSYAPVKFPGVTKTEKLSIRGLTKSCFESTNRMATVEAEKGKYVACCLIYRGDVGQQEVSDSLSQAKNSSSVQFVDWSPTGFKVGMNASPKGKTDDQDPSLALIANSTSLADYIAKLNHKFDLMYKKMAFVHWYFAEGLEANEFIEAREDTSKLEEDYINLKD